ncbi:CHAT domain-containing protein [Suillus ampliporus]|nr:CHAT domain-containing protein [Suillus ampliporus]
MSTFVPDPLDDPPPLSEEPNYPQQPLDPEKTNLVISEMLQVVVNIILAMLCFIIIQLFRFATHPALDPLDDILPPLNEDPSPPECPQDQEETHLSEQRVAITTIRATDLTLGLRRLPAGFHVTVQADGAEWQTSNRPVHVGQDVIEWDERILLPSEPSSKIRVSVYASFELGPMLGHGDFLRTFEISVGELLDRSEKSHPVVFQPKTGEVVSSCTSLFMTAEQLCSDEHEAVVLRPLTTLTSSDMQTLVLRTDAGHRLLARYRRTQNSRDLDQSITHFKRASDLCPIDHPCHPAALCNIANAKFASCQVNGTYLDLDMPISFFQDSIDLRPTGHPDRPITQFHLAIALLSRFAKRGFQTDADAAQELLEEILHICPANSHVHRAALLAIETSAQHPVGSIDANNLGHEWPVAPTLPLSPNELVRRARLCEQSDDPHALNEVISLHYDALGYYSETHDQRGQLLCNLGSALLIRFERQGNSKDLDTAIALHIEALALCPHRANGQDLDEAIVLQREALALCPVGHPDRSPALNNLGNQLSTRFDHRGNDRDLDEAVSFQREALALCPVGHPARSLSLSNLGNQLYTRFLHRGNDQDLDEAILLHSEALALRPVGHPDRPPSLSNLGNGLSTRFLHRGNDQDLDEAIVLHSEALALRPVGHSARSSSLNNLGSQLSTRFKHRGNDQDLDEAVTLHREALALRPVGHSDRSSSLNNLGSQLSTRFDHRGNVQDLDEAMLLHREALTLRPVGHPDRSSSLSHLGNGLSTRFQHLGNDQDSDEAILLQREALALCPVGHPARFSSLSNIGSQLSTRFKHRGNDQDLDEAILLHREALALCPVGHSNRSSSLYNLGNGLYICFKHRGHDQDLDEAVVLHREALALHPVGHPDRSSSLSNLGTLLSTRFEQRGNDQDLDEAIVFYREVLALRPVGHTDWSLPLDNLGSQLSTRFKHRGNDQDLDEAIMLHREALALRPVGHSSRPVSLNNLGNGLYNRFEQRGNDEDLDEAIALHSEALALRPVGHQDRPSSLNNLGSQLFTRFNHRSNDQDLDEAILLQREALALYPVGHPDLPFSLHNLGNALSSRFAHRGNAQDLHESLETHRCELNQLTQYDPRRSMSHLSLAAVYLLLHRGGLDDTGEDTDNLNAAMEHLKAAANVVSAGLLVRLRASLSWVYHADQHAHGTELEAYSTSMHLLDAYMSATASVSSRHSAMKVFPRTLAVNAASCALRHGDVCRAVELLEQGRTLIWTQMARLRTPLDSLQERGDHAESLMKKFRDLSSLLDKPPPNDSEGMRRNDVEAEATRYRYLVEDWNTAVEEIRKLDGFAHFLLPPLFSDLQDAACEGPIVILIASESSCDAIIIPHKQPPTSIQLPTDLERVVRLVLALQENVERDAGPKKTQSGLIKALRELWDDVVRPVVEHLDRFARKGSRIWWCPTSIFNFLPLHAAGEYKRGGKSLSQLYVSSYTPSLTALIRARRSNDGSMSVSFAAIGQNHPPGHSFPLEAVEPELELVQSLLPRPPTVFFTKVTSIESTKSKVLHTLQDHHWLHFACHGTQNFEEPFKSAFLMRDQPLSLLDVTQIYLSRHEFAFLSACETAVGDVTTPDEVIHLAAGLQFAGVKSVVGTLWKVNDATVRRLVEAFYKNFCGDSKMDSKRAARALHRAVQSLASDKDMLLDQRIVFMHIGI